MAVPQCWPDSGETVTRWLCSFQSRALANQPRGHCTRSWALNRFMNWNRRRMMAGWRLCLASAPNVWPASVIVSRSGWAGFTVTVSRQLNRPSPNCWTWIANTVRPQQQAASRRSPPDTSIRPARHGCRSCTPFADRGITPHSFPTPHEHTNCEKRATGWCSIMTATMVNIVAR